MKATCRDGIVISGLLLVSLFLLILSPRSAMAVDTVSKGRNITDNGTTLVSADGAFTMGFFSPGVPTKRYLGIWFTVSSSSNDTVVCWVANRDRPINDNSGVLYVSDTGSLVLLDGSSGQVAWSSNSTSASPVEAQLHDTGDLVVRNQGSTATLWHSFNYPQNVLLSGMKVGKDFNNLDEWYLTSWRSADDPSPGAYIRRLDTTGLPDNIVWQGNVKTFRAGPWNGLEFGGIPEANRYRNDLFTNQMIISSREVTYGYQVLSDATFTYLMLTETGDVRRVTWDRSSKTWLQNYQGPRDLCDKYGHCGAFGVCNSTAMATSPCSCLTGYSPASPSSYSKDSSGGCRRNVKRDDCGQAASTDDVFLPVRGVKLPDTHNATVDVTISVEQCRARCLANCSCLAYAASTISKDGKFSGCVMWSDDLIDLRYVDAGQDMYLRLTESELPQPSSPSPSPSSSPPPPPSSPSTSFPTVAAAGGAGAVVGITFIALLITCVIKKKRGGRRASLPSKDSRSTAALLVVENHPPTTGSPSPPRPATPTVPRSQMHRLREATGDFSESNIIGRGGFGNVYEGHLPPDGEKVAVKRVRDDRKEGNGEAFMREVKLMSRLRHENLCQLLTYCNDGNEQIVVYKYMKNGSLDAYIFGDPGRRALLNWEQRLKIIRGVAKGVVYLHGQSPEVIHRDLKPSNILLDDNWRPKIADFGTAKIFTVNDTNPTRIQSIYTAPEFIMHQDLTLKCDVYSFGVILLEVVSGKKKLTSGTFFHDDAWEAWKQQTIGEFVDPAVAQPKPEHLLDLERCVQTGLHCVQESPDDRPTMSAVVTMLKRNGPRIPLPKKPVFGRRYTSPLPQAHLQILVEASTSNSSSHQGHTLYQTAPVSNAIH